MVESRWMRALRAVGFSLALGASLLGGAAHAQGSSTPIRILVGFPPGGGTDAIARLLGEKMKDQLGGETVIVDNKAGAGGQIAAQALKAAPPDGHTVFISHDHTISILPLVTKNPGFDPAKDFVPVAGFATFVNALAVSGGTPARSMSEYIAWVRQNGGKGNVGVPAPASVPEFLVKLIGQKYGLDLQAAPYRGSAPMMADMLGNQIGAGVGSIPDFIENHKAGKIRVVAVMGNQRQAAVPDAPTFAELGLAGFEDVPYYGFFAPAGTPQAAIDRFSGALQKVLAEPDVRQQLTNLGLTVGFMSSQQLGARERAYTATWAKLIKNLGVQPQ
jgi:tripartite-type tricarboxylate transporter receptor subunit TctC